MKFIIKRTIITLIGLATLAALFYAEEDLRGWLAWENCKHELAAKGEALDWNAYIPPPVPDDQNFFKASKMAARFVKLPAMPNRWASADDFTESEEFSKRLRSNTNTTATITTEPAARDYLAWSDQLEPDFDLMREALKRPYARMDGDYSIPNQIPIPNFVAVRYVAQTLAQRAKCDLLLGQTDKALQELTLLHDMCRLLEAAPTGKPMTLVAAMMNVAVAGLYVDTIADGLRLHAWQEPQLAALQKQLADINLTSFVFQAIREEPANACRFFEEVSVMDSQTFKQVLGVSKTWKWEDLKHPIFWLLEVAPHGWIYQNMVNVAMLDQESIDAFDLEHDTGAPRKIEEATRAVDEFVSHGKSPYKLLAAIGIPNFARAEQTTAHNQTMVNEAQIACALERYHLAHGEYPETLDALAPQFIEKLPHDIIGGDPLNYRPTLDGKFLLYSVGWNETDDGGVDSSQIKSTSPFELGDWVWKN